MHKALDDLLASVRPHNPDAEWSTETAESGLPFALITLPSPQDPFGPTGYVVVTPSSCGSRLELGDHNVPLTAPFQNLLALTDLEPLWRLPPTPQATGDNPHGTPQAREGLAR